MKQINRKIVLVGGCFDLIHFGHISYLKKAKALGDYLIVALESDENVRWRKGERRPIHTQKQREEMLQSLWVVDEVRLLPTMRAESEYTDLVNQIRPAVIAVTQGDVYLKNKQKQAKLVEAKLVVIPKIHTPSTSQLAKLLELE